jgi:hypothetical protein
MKTAIQELFSKLEIEHPNLFNTNTLEGREFINSYYKFFELEKKQIIDCWNKRSKIDGVLTFTDNRTGEQYYNETFKK